MRSHVPVLLAAAFLVLAAPTTRAGSYRNPHLPDTYVRFTGGGYGLTGLSSPDPVDGLFLGFEMGVSPSPFLELGVTADWLRRRDGTSEVFLVDSPYDLPVEGVIDLEKTSVDLVPLGAVLRLRFPVAEGRLVPFVAGQVTYDLLRLSAQGATPDGMPTFDATDYFTGAGTTISAGLEASLERSIGLVFEAGAHHARPDKQLDWAGEAVRGRVDVTGGFARVGLRFGFR